MSQVDPTRDLDAALAPVLDRLLTPALVIDLDAVTHNTAKIRAIAGERWRPHIKTLKQSALIRILLEAGVRKLKCATLDELRLALETARESGSEAIDVLFAYPPREPLLRGVLDARASHPRASIRVLADSPAHLAELDRWADGEPLGVLLDVDTGNGRTGSSPSAWRAARDPLSGMRRIRVDGLHGYEGHLGRHQQAECEEGFASLLALADELGLGDPLIVTSGSPTFRHALAWKGFAGRRHEVSPGTVVLSDLDVQRTSPDLGLRLAAFVASRAISRPTAERLTLDAGSKAVSPDKFPSCAVLGWPGLEPVRSSEEHLVVKVAGDAPEVGRLLWLAPAHVCTTVNLYRRVLYLRGGRLAGEGTVEAAGHALWRDG